MQTFASEKFARADLKRIYEMLKWVYGDPPYDGDGGFLDDPIEVKDIEEYAGMSIRALKKISKYSEYRKACRARRREMLKILEADQAAIVESVVNERRLLDNPSPLL